MSDISREEYERWLRENNVPDYKRALYNDDPRLVMVAVRREQEQERRRREAEAAERARLAEEERLRTGSPSRSSGVYGTQDLYDDGEDRPYIEEEDEDYAGLSSIANGETPSKEEKKSPRERTSLYGNTGDEEKKQSKEVKKTKVKKKKKADSGSKEKSGKAGKFILAAAVAALIVLVIVISVINSLDFGTYKLGYVTIGEVTEDGAARAYFARSGEALFSTASGIFMSSMSEGDRIEAGGTVGYIVREENKGVLTKLKQTNAKILALMSLVSDTTLSETEAKLSAINERIEEERVKLSEMGLTGNLSDCGEVENTINSLISERNALLIEAENGSDSILSLKREKEELEKIVNEKMIPVVSPKAGIVSFHISDSENVENELYESLTAGDGSARLSSLSLLDNAGVYTKLNENVASGDKVCRIIDNQNYYVILKITKQVSTLSGLLTVKSGDLSYQATGQLGEALYGEDYAVLSTMRGLKASLGDKNIDVTFDVSKSTGYAVPLSALTDWDKNNTTARLAVVKAGYVQFMYVGIKAWDSEKAIITSSPYDDAVIVYADGSPVPESKIATITAGTCYVVDSERVRDGQQIS